MKRRLKEFIISLACLIPLQIYMIKVWLPEFLKFSGGLNNLDSRLRYTGKEVTTLLSILGDEGIGHYFNGILIDSTYAILMGLTVYFLFKQVRGTRINYKIIIRLTYLIPSLYLISDWIENIGIIYFLKSYPNKISGVSLFSTFTTIKQVMPIVSMLFLIFLTVLRIKNRKIPAS